MRINLSIYLTLPLKNSTQLQLFFEHVSFPNLGHFLAHFRCRSFGVSRIFWLKKFQNPNIHVSIVSHHPNELAYVVSTTNMPFEAGNLLKLRKDPCLFFRAHDRLLFQLKLQRKKFGRRATSKANPQVDRQGVKRGSLTTQRRKKTRLSQETRLSLARRKS